MSSVIATRATELAKKDGAEKLAAWKTAWRTRQLACGSQVVSRDQPHNLPAPVLAAALAR